MLDASVAVRWALLDGSGADRQYADRVLDSLVDQEALVPALWYTETVQVLRCAEREGLLGESAVTAFLSQLAKLPIAMDQTPPAAIQLAAASVSREFRLSGYDAQYLELATRRKLSIATLDRDFRKSARRAGVGIYLG